MQKKLRGRKRRRRNDIILVCVLLAAAFLGGVYLFVARPMGDTVKVTVAGEIFGEYPLWEDITKDIYSGEDGSGHNRLVIKDGKAFVETATCPDGICSSHRPICRDGESIICLPHKVVISVSSANGGEVPNTEEGPDVEVE